jgi:hypothetical protein
MKAVRPTFQHPDSITEDVWKGMRKVDAANLVEPADRIRLDAAS